MIKVVGFSSLPLTCAQREELTRVLNQAGEAVFPGQFCLSLRSFPEEYATTNAKFLINCIALIPSSTTLDEKRQLSVALHRAVVDLLGEANHERVTILFWNYEPDAFAVDGRLLSENA